MSGKIKILFLLEDLCYGGTQKQNLELALRLNRDRFEPIILTFTGPTDMDNAAVSLPLYHLGNSRKVSPLFFLQLPGILSQLKPDIILPCTALPNIWGRIWGKVLNIPLIVGTCRGGGAPIRQHERLLWRITSHIVCNSEALIHAMTKYGIPEEHMSYIANGIDSNIFKPDARLKHKNSPLIVCVARLAKDKNHKLLVRAFEQAWIKKPELRLRLVGEGPEEANIRNFVSSSIAREASVNIEFAGSSSNPLHHYQEADIFALSSSQEGQPNVILEAMSCGLPVCATSVGGIPAMVKHGQTGFLSQSGDAPAMAKNILKLLENNELKTNMGVLARKEIEAGYSFKTMVSAHENLFENLFEKYSSKKYT